MTETELEECKQTFADRGIRTFRDRLRYYNDLDVVPDLEALVKMQTLYGDLGINIFKDAVFILGVSLQYLTRGTLPNAPEIYAPCPEGYKMLKGGVVGRLSIIFTRYH